MRRVGADVTAPRREQGGDTHGRVARGVHIGEWGGGGAAKQRTTAVSIGEQGGGGVASRGRATTVGMGERGSSGTASYVAGGREQRGNGAHIDQ